MSTQGRKAAAAVESGGAPAFLLADGHGKIYIYLEDKNAVAVAGTKRMDVINRWPNRGRVQDCIPFTA